MLHADEASYRYHWQWLLLVPLIAVFCIPFFNRLEPYFFGWPFFYWYQLMWIVLSTLIVAIVYLKTYMPEIEEEA